MKKALITIIFGIASVIVFSSKAYASEKASIQGSDYVDTSIKISQKGWTSSNYAIVASSEDFPDALGGTSLAGTLDCPIFFASKDSVSSSVLSELKRLNVKTVYVLGGEGSISATVENNIQSQGYSTKRLAGSDRFETAVAIGQEVVDRGKTDTVFIANGYGFADALSGASFAGKMNAPILLTNSDHLNDVDIQALKKWGIKKYYILGGSGVVKQGVIADLLTVGDSYTQIAGTNRYETSQGIVKQFDTSLDKLTVVTGKDYHDALVAAPYASKLNQPLLLMDSDCIDDYVKFALNKNLLVIGKSFLIPDNNSVTVDGVTFNWEEVKSRLLNINGMVEQSITNVADGSKLLYVSYNPSSYKDDDHYSFFTLNSIRSTRIPYMDFGFCSGAATNYTEDQQK